MAQVAPPQVFSHGGARPQTKGFAAATAEVTGESKAQINRNLARAEAIGPALTTEFPFYAGAGIRAKLHPCHQPHRPAETLANVVLASVARMQQAPAR